MKLLTSGTPFRWHRLARALRAWLILVVLAALIVLPAPAFPSAQLQATSTNWLAAQPLLAARQGHTATLLTDGRVMAIGGLDASGPVAGVEVYDPATGAWGAIATMRTPRWGHTATLLPNGSVLVLGGSRSATLQGGDWAIDDSEMYDPGRGWIPAPRMPIGRVGHTATLLRDGRVLVVGGVTPAGPVDRADIYDPSNATWEPAPAVPGARWLHTATRLRDGSVLVAGGSSSLDEAGYLNSTAIYSVASGRWSLASPMLTTRARHTATLLANGAVLVVGGFNGLDLSSVELFEPASNAWTPVRDLLDARRDQSATLLPNGQLLIAGGMSGGAYPATTYAYDPGANAWNTAGTLPGGGRARQTATLLPSGRVLLVGGWAGATSSGAADLYEAGIGQWGGAGTMNSPRADHTATLLPDGRVLVVGGAGAAGEALTSTEVYSPETGLWTPLASSLPGARDAHTATLLSNGKVLVVGGKSGNSATSTSALFDPGSTQTGAEQWSAAAPLHNQRFAHTATLLPNGKVLVAGGNQTSAGSMPLASAEIYDPAQNTWTDAGSMAFARAFHTATLLPNGNVLVVGGGDANGSSVSLAYDSAELYDWTNDTWTTIAQRMPEARWNHTATLLPNGKVLIAGGGNSDGSSILNSALLFSPADGGWSNAASLTVPRRDHRAALLLDGRVLVAGGFPGNGSSELYDPATDAWASAGALGAGRHGHTLTLLMDGRVLMAGGAGAGAAAELFDAGLGFSNTGRPTITHVTPSVAAFYNIAVDGFGFMGASEAASGGTQQSATSYPLLQIRSLSNDQTLYVGQTPNSTWTPTRFISSNIDVARKPFPAGYALATIFVNGIPSVAKPLQFRRIRYVSAERGGDNSNDCLRSNAPCRTIQAAIEQAETDDQIQIEPGTYAESLTLDKRLIIRRTDQALQPDAPPTDAGLVTITGSPDQANADESILQVTRGGGGTLSGVTIKNAGAARRRALLNDGNVQLASVIIEGGRAQDGGGVYNRGYVGIYYSAVISNTATRDGGAIYNAPGALANLIDTTMSGNQAAGAGGAVFNAGELNENGGLINGGSLGIHNATLTNNTAASGGGLFVMAGSNAPASAVTVVLLNTILAGNHAAESPDCQGAIRSRGYNLLGDATGCTITTLPDSGGGDIVGSTAALVDPRLEPLARNGIDRLSHALLLDSPALDAGNPARPTTTNDACIVIDQLGTERPQNGRCDIGAFERKRPTHYVATRADGGDDANDCQTRAKPCEHIAIARRGLPPDGVVEMSAGAYDESVDLTGGLALVGAGAGVTTLRGRVVVGAATTVASITALTITNPTPFAGDGGAIFNAGSLTLRDSVVKDSASGGNGGAIYSTGALTLDQTTVSGNRAAGGDGGGIDARGPLTIRASHITGNTATRGGGLIARARSELSGTTVSSNTATLQGGGGINNLQSGEMTIRGGAISGNTAVQGGGIVNAGTLTIQDKATISGNDSGIAAPNADKTGGGIRNSGTLRITDSTVLGNRAGTRGGGLFNVEFAQARIENSSITGNSAEEIGGGLLNQGLLWFTGGEIAKNSAPTDAGLLNYGTATLTSTEVLSNSARLRAGITNARNAILFLTAATVGGNTAERGGGITNGGEMSIAASRIIGNTARVSTAGIGNEPTGTLTIVGSEVTGNDAGTGGGGGIANYAQGGDVGVVRIAKTLVSGNHAQSSAGIGNAGDMTITASQIVSNTAEQQAGMYNGPTGVLRLADSTVSHNSASGGIAGLHNDGGRAWIGNSTISTNTARDGAGGGIRYDSTLTSTLVITSTTIANNTANRAGGFTIQLNAAQTNQPILENTILADNIATSGIAPDCEGTLDSRGHNLIGDARGCVFTPGPGDLAGTITDTLDPLLGPLADHGGPTPTHALLKGSPAIDAGANAACPPTDQRGIARPYGPFCDIGAYELNGLRTSGLDLASDIWHDENPAGRPSDKEFMSDFNYAATTRLITETHVLSDISALDALDLPIALEALDVQAVLPLTITDVITPGGRLVPNPSAYLYLQIVKTVYDDENLRYYDGVIRSGLCAGMSASVADFNRPQDDPSGPPPAPAAFGGTTTVASIPLDPPEPPNPSDPALQSARSLIQRYQGRQMGSQILNWMATRGQGMLDPNSLFGRIAARIGSEQWRRDPEIIGINQGASCDDFEVGHALLPYAVEANNGHGLIYVYDSNYPSAPNLQRAQGHVIDIDFATNTWMYHLVKDSQRELTWKGSTIYGVPLSLFRQQPTLPALADTDIVMVNGGNRLAWGGNRLAWGGNRLAWGEVTDTKTRTGCYIPVGGTSAEFVRDINISLRAFPMTGPRLLDDGQPIFPETLFFQAGQDMTFTSARGQVRDLVLFGPHAVMGLLGTAREDTRDSVAIDKTFHSLTFRKGDVSRPEDFTLYQMHETATANPNLSETRVYAVSNVSIQKSDALTMTVATSLEHFELVNSGDTALKLDIGLAGIGPAGVSSIAVPDQLIGGDERRVYTPTVWTDLSSGAIDVAIYDATDGILKGTTTIYPPSSPGSTTQVRARFNQPDGALGPDWYGARDTDHYHVQNNQVRVNQGGPLYWKNDVFGATQEAFVTLAQINPRGEEQGVLLKVQGMLPHYRSGAIKAVYDAAKHEVRVMTYQPLIGWRHVARFSRLFFQDGDQLGARARSDGHVEVYRNERLLGIADTRTTNGNFFTTSGGRIGLWFNDTRQTRFDDFGGGNTPLAR